MEYLEAFEQHLMLVIISLVISFVLAIAASINAGGLGIVLFSGMRTMDSQKIFIGTLLCIVIALVADIGIKCIENKIDWRVRVKNEL